MFDGLDTSIPGIAALAGLPSVATRVGGIPEAVEDGVTVHRADCVALARLLLQAGADARRTDRYGASAIAHARGAGHEALARFLEQGGP